MNAAQHLDRSEQLLEQLRNGEAMPHDEQTLGMALEATAHALVAIADILGVAHAVDQHPAVSGAN